MLGPAIGAVRQNPAMRQVRKTQAKGNRRPGIDSGQDDEDRAPEPQKPHLPIKPIGPIASRDMVVERPAIVHQDEGRIADQCRYPTGQIWVGSSDMRIKRLHRQRITDRCELHINHEHRRDQRVREPHRILPDLGKVHVYQIAESRRDNRDHESQEKTFYRPCAQMMANFLSIPIVTSSDPRAKVPTAIAGVDHVAIEPDDIRHRDDHQGNGDEGEDLHRKQILPGPIPAAEHIKRGNARPCRPEPGNLDDAGIEHFGDRPFERPIEARGRTAMNLINQ